MRFHLVVNPNKKTRENVPKRAQQHHKKEQISIFNNVDED
jgi:hypothetical protein